MPPLSTGRLIAEHRKTLNLTQKQLADRLDVTNKAVSKWENDQGLPDVSLLAPLSRVLGVSVDSLLTGNPPPTGSSPPAADSLAPRSASPFGNFSIPPDETLADNSSTPPIEAPRTNLAPTEYRESGTRLPPPRLSYAFLAAFGLAFYQFAIHCIAPVSQTVSLLLAPDAGGGVWVFSLTFLPAVLIPILFWGGTAFYCVPRVSSAAWPRLRELPAALLAALGVIFLILQLAACAPALPAYPAMGISFLLFAAVRKKQVHRLFYFLTAGVILVSLAATLAGLLQSDAPGHQLVLLNKLVTLAAIGAFWLFFGLAARQT